MSEARMPAFSCELLIKVVVRWLPFHFKTEPVTNPVPFTVKVNPVELGDFVSGTRGWLMRGTEFCAWPMPVSEPQAMTMLISKYQVVIWGFVSLDVIVPLFAFVNQFSFRRLVSANECLLADSLPDFRVNRKTRASRYSWATGPTSNLRNPVR